MKTSAGPCGECKVRPADFLCGCGAPWPKLCKDCSVQHQTKSASFHSLLPVKYLPTLKTQQDFQRTFLRETQTAEVLDWLQTNVEGIATEERKLDLYVAQIVQHFEDFKSLWASRLQNCRDSLVKDLAELKGKLDSKPTQLEKLRIIKERRENLLSFHLAELDLVKAVDQSTHLSLFSPISLQEETLDSESFAEVPLDQGEMMTCLQRMINSCKGTAQVLGETLAELSLPPSLAGYMKQAEYILTQTLNLACHDHSEIEAICDLLLGTQATGSLKEKLRTVQSCVSAAKEAARELPRSLRTQTIEAQLRQEVSHQTEKLSRLASQVTLLEQTLSTHQDCDILRTALQAAEMRAKQAEIAQTQAQLQLQDNLEQYCRKIINQHKKRLNDLCVDLTKGLQDKSSRDLGNFQTFQQESNTCLIQGLGRLNEVVAGLDTLQTEISHLSDSQSALTAMSSHFPLREESSPEWSAAKTQLRQASDRLRREAGSRTALFLTNVVDSAFGQLEKVLAQGDERLGKMIESLKGLIESPNLIAVETWAHSCKSVLPKKKWGDFDAVMACYSAFRDELSGVFRSVYDEFGINQEALQAARKCTLDQFCKQCPALLSEPIATLSRDADAVIEQASALHASDLAQQLTPLSKLLTRTQTGLNDFLQQLQSVSKDTQQVIQTEIQKCVERFGTALVLNSDTLRDTVQASVALPIPDFPPSISIQPLPLEAQTQQLANLHSRHVAVSTALETLTAEHFHQRLQCYTQAIEQVWQKELRGTLSAWTARSLRPGVPTVSERGLSALRLDLPGFSPLHCITVLPALQADPLPTLQAFQYFDKMLGQLYEDDRKALYSSQPLSPYSLLTSKYPDFERAAATMKLLYGHEQPQAIVFAKLFGLFGEQGLTAESCFVVNYYRQLFQRLAYAKTTDVPNSWISVCCEVNLADVLKAMLPRVIRNSSSLPVWIALLAHLKPVNISVRDFGWAIARWLLTHRVPATAISILEAARGSSLQSALYLALDCLLPHQVLSEMLGEEMQLETFEAALSLAEPCQLLVRGDLFLCGVIAAIETLTIDHPAFSTAVVLVP